MPNFISSNELFDRILDIIHADEGSPINKMLHETLVLVCSQGLTGNNLAFGNLFSKIDFLCKKHHVAPTDAIAIQQMRRHSNHAQAIDKSDLMYDCRALAIFISAVFDTDIPSSLVGLLPVEDKPQQEYHNIDYSYIRCIVKNFDKKYLTAEIDQDSTNREISIHLKEKQAYLDDILKEGMQINLIDVTSPLKEYKGKSEASIIVIEPDFLIDISSIARCFTDYGHNPLSYTINRIQPIANSQATLIGNFAGDALDDIINNNTNYDWRETFKNNFKDKALEYCTCPDLNKKEDFRLAAIKQTKNILQIVDYIKKDYLSPESKNNAILEPSLICEQLGLQGRADLITNDFSLLAEQKSGKNINIEYKQPNEHGSFHKEDHYVQLLLYYAVLKQNFHLNRKKTDIRLLYSKYPLSDGVVVVNIYQELFHEAIKFRNQLVSNEFKFAIKKFDGVIEKLTPNIFNKNKYNNVFFNKWILPKFNELLTPLHHLSSLEKSYFNRMMTFVYREQLASKVGSQEGLGNCIADLWNMPLAEKKETGNIYTNLRIINKEKSNDFNGYDTITFNVPDQGADFLPNFRIGDMIYMYAYKENAEPDVRKTILFKGYITDIHSNRITVHLTDGQQDSSVFADTTYAIEHSGSDASTTSAIRSLHNFITSRRQSFKDLLLAQRQPRKDENIQLSRSYNPSYDEIILKAKQALDYFLLVGPPGTGKTSMALQYMVRESISSDQSILLMSYTNRAVDEICGMLSENNIDYIRIGNEFTCDTKYRQNLLSQIIENCPKLNVIRQKILDCKVIVGTTSTIQGKSYLFNLKHFSTVIVDEASQILEPNIIGLLAQADSKFVLIGDYKQLPAVVQQDSAVSSVNDVSLNNICLDNCRNSLFERLIHIENANNRDEFTGVLRRQGRMHPDIAEFPNKMFYYKENLQPVPLEHQTKKQLEYSLESIDYLDDALKAHRMVFIPSRFCKEPNISDKVNSEEAKIVTDILRRIYRFYGNKFYADKTVGVIVPYRNQISMIRKEIEKLGIHELEDISIDTVERYQGSQRDVIIYSFTIQNRYQLDFLTSNCFEEDDHIIDRKLNVAITRARKQMILTGNAEILNNDIIFKSLIEHVKSKGGYIEYE